MEFSQIILRLVCGAWYLLFWGPQAIMAIIAFTLVSAISCVAYGYEVRIGPFRNIPLNPEKNQNGC